MRRLFFFLALAALSGALAGCSITTHDKHDGKGDNVDIKTPLGSIKVQEGRTDVKDTGLALYPGARSVKEFDEKHNSANVDISSSFFGVKVVALKFESDDSPDKVMTFYRKEMGKFGKVLDCTGSFNMNFRMREKDSEVTCNGSNTGHEYRQELKVGTENNQRIMAIKPKGNGSEFALVYVRKWDHKDTM